MSTLTIKFHGVQDEILQALIDSGIAQSKSEAIRMALLKFCMDLGIFDSKEIMATIRKEMQKEPLPPNQVAEGIKKAKHDSISR